jgi:methionyl-tRNA formyltransferase
MTFRIAFMGTPQFAVPSLDALVDAGHTVAAAICQPDKPAGRRGEPAPPPVKRRALELGLEVFQPRTLRHPRPLERLRDFAPELIVVVAYGKILPKEVLDLPRRGCINVHGSLLPALRGAAPVQWAIASGLARTGVTTMLMDEGMDTGPILLQREMSIWAEETGAELAERMARLGAQLLVETLRLWHDSSIQPRPQPEEGVSYAPILSKEDGYLDWSDSAHALAARVRGFWPWPGAVCRAPRGESMKIHRARVAALEAAGAEPGTVLDIADGGITVACGSGALLLQELQPESRKRMPAAELARGYRLEPGARFGRLTPDPQQTTGQ